MAMAVMVDDQVDLLQPFTSFESFREMLGNLLPTLQNANSAAAAVLALEGLFRIEADVHSGQFDWTLFEDILREFLRKWRCESPLNEAYGGAYGRVIPFLRSLSIFTTLEVPLFIDNYGVKKPLSHYRNLVNEVNRNDGFAVPSALVSICGNLVHRATIAIEKILIDPLNTPIVHVTHSQEAQQIVQAGMFIPSANKNIIAGTWFGLGIPSSSIYGCQAFETTLSELGVSGIRQGEIVSYKQEVNVILYASDTVSSEGLLKPTENLAKLSQNHRNAYVTVSIFVPWKFLPQQGEAFFKAVRGPYQIPHGPFCVKAKRSAVPMICAELSGIN